ncbi:unnamed protein product [Caenorhabditis bovis]|uniref:Uncharacterized protein n=1 Tax=Caenorhabditis bovis TaxID=2654633 RepID=A0A8S1ELU9_9PELO|nr:unnamed protein product [Caenorhabditis bovis]
MAKVEECGSSNSEENSRDSTSSPMSSSGPSETPEFSQKYYDIEPCYYSLNGKSDRNCRGKVFRFREDGDLKGFEAHDNVMYHLKDCVFVEISPSEPYVIAVINSFKYTKREHVVMKLTRYFRAEDIPEISLNLMKQERAELNINPHLCPVSLNRELFNSEISITQPVSCLRGKCTVEYVNDIKQARTVADFSRDNDTFFSCLHFNQDSSKLSSIQYQIRVGDAFQATLPPVAECSVGDEKDRDELVYRPGCIDEQSEAVYIRLARTYRNYTLSNVSMLDSQKNARVSDLLMDEAICQLHRSGYKIDDALNEMAANDILLASDVDYMTADDAKKFAKGIKSLGKNFSRIHRELLPHHSREQLVAYYYLWKKTPEATKPKQTTRRVNQTVIKRPKNEKTKVSRTTSTEYLDFDSASESDVENNGPSGRACHHCFGTESKDWHHANNLLLCTTCRVHYKKYGQLRSVEKPATVPACLFKRANSNDEEESGVRTRAGKKENNRKRTPSSMSETPDRTRSPAVNGANHDEGSPSKRVNGSAKRNGKRPLNQQMQQASCSNAPSPSVSPPANTNGIVNGSLENGHVKNGETTPKKPKMDIDSDDDDCKMMIDEGDDSNDSKPTTNGVKKDEPEAAKPVNGEISNGVIQTATTSEGESSKKEDEQIDDEDDENVTPDNAEDTYTIGSEVICDTQNANFVRAFVRSCGQRCARTDLIFKFKEGSVWDVKRREKEKRKADAEAAAAANAANAAHAGPQLHSQMPGAPPQLKKEQMSAQVPPQLLHSLANGMIPNGLTPQIIEQINRQFMVPMASQPQQAFNMVAGDPLQAFFAVLQQQQQHEQLAMLQQQQQQQPIPHPIDMQQLMLGQMMMLQNPALAAQMQGQIPAVLPHGMVPPSTQAGAYMNSEMMRRLTADAAIRPQHQ